MRAMKISSDPYHIELTEHVGDYHYVWCHIQMNTDGVVRRGKVTLYEDDLVAIRQWADKQLYKIRKVKAKTNKP
jgi:hypothetical protein